MKVIRYLLLMLAVITAVSVKGQYNPSNPAEPGRMYSLALRAIPSNVGSFNISTRTNQQPGTGVQLYAYNNGDYKFVRWETTDGTVVSADAKFNYIMPSKNSVLVARYQYSPSSPGEPASHRYSKITFESSPAGSGYFNMSSGNKYEVGSSVNLCAYNNSNYKFVSWTENGAVVSTEQSFYYEVKERDSKLVANFVYSPSNPQEPSVAPVYHRLTVKSNPQEGGYFNVSGTNRYAEGSTVTLYAYSNSYYTFKNWSLNGEVISTEYRLNYVIPDKDVTLVANYDYNYNPSNPDEPASASSRYHLYGMRVNVIAGQNVGFPVYLENFPDVNGFSIDVTFPKGFAVNANGATLTERASGQTMEITDLGNNAFRFIARGTEAFKGANGKILEIPVVVPDTVTVGNSFSVALSKGAVFKTDGAQTPVATHTGAFKINMRPDELPDSPDFVVKDIKADKASVAPGDMIGISWNISNTGNLAATGGWSERVSLVTENGKKTTLGTFYYETQSLAVGESVSRQADIALSSLLGIDGKVKVSVTVIPSSYAGEAVEFQENNTSETAGYLLSVSKKLYLQMPDATLTEGTATTVRCKLERSGNRSESETYKLTKTKGDSRVTVPASVIIPRNQSGAYFYINMSDNDVLDVDSVFSVEVSGNGYDSVTGMLIVEDDEYPQIDVKASKTDVTEGETFQLAITLPRVSSGDVTVNITSEQPKRFSHPASVTIPAGRTNATVDVTAVENDEVELQTSVSFKISAEKYQNGECLIMLNDNDLPAIDLELSPVIVSESAGPSAIVAKLRRLSNKDKRVTIQLSDDSNGDIYYSNTNIVLDKGVEEVQFSMGVVDNATVDGDRKVNITAAVYVSSCSCSASGSSVGKVTKVIEIIDNDGPSLGIVSSKSTLLEGNDDGIALTITRNTDTSKALTVSISSDYDAGLAYEHNVTIPAGEKSVDVKVKALPNSASGDDRTVVFTVECDNFSKGTCWVMLSDQTLPDARISAITVSKSEVEAGSDIDVKVTINNAGAAVLPEVTKIGVYLNNITSPIMNMYTQQALAPGEQATLSKTVTLPSAVGEYSLYAVANDGNEVKELLYVNNTSERVKVKTNSPFTTSVAVDKKTYQQGEAVKISGKVTGNGSSGADVEVYIINDGLRQTITATTDADGNFDTTFQPYAAQMGRFSVGACYPGEGLKEEKASFNVYGLKLTSNSPVTCETLLGETYTGKIEVSNPGVLSLSGVKVKVVSKPDNYDVAVTCPAGIAAGNIIAVEYSVVGKGISQGNDWEPVNIQLEAGEGATLTTTLYCYCRNPKGQLTTDISAINTTMVKGATRDYPIQITNIGKGATGKITLSLPAWMTTATPAEMMSLAPGESTTAILRFIPTDAMQLNVPVIGTIGINCENGDGIPLNYSVEPVSDAMGKLIVDVCDEYTYYTAEAPHVEGAQVIVKHPTTKAVLMTAISGKDGKCEFSLSEGYYYVTVTEPKHGSFTGNIMVNPGVETKKTVNLGINGITVDMKYEETEIKDEYRIVTKTKYETNVPIPVVETILPARIMADELQPGESLMFYAQLVNHGLITAQNTQVQLPEYLDDLEITVLGEKNFPLLPNQTVSIPVKVTRMTSEMRARAAHSPAKKAASTCKMEEITFYESECGEDRKIHTVKHTIQIKVCSPTTEPDVSPNRPIVVEGGWGGSGLPSVNGGGGGGTVGNSELGNIIADKVEAFVCDPCVNKFMNAFANCNDWDPEHPIQSAIEKIPIVGDIAGCGFDIYNSSYGKGEYMTLGNSGKALFKCALKACQAIGGYLVGIGGATAITGVGAAPGAGMAAGGAIAKAVCEFLDDTTDDIDCLTELLKPCKDASASRAKGARSANTGFPSYITQFQDKIAVFSDGRKALQDYANELLGFDEFKKSDMAELSVLFDKISEFPAGHIIDMKEIELYKPDNISSEVFAAFIERANNTTRRSLGQTVTGDYVDLNVIEDCRSRILESVEAAKKYGYDGISDMVTDAYTQLLEGYDSERQSVCASITLSLSQTMTMTRKAIRGTLTVQNGHETDSMSDIKLKLAVLDDTGSVVGSDIMHVAAESLNGFTGQLDLQSGWSLEAASQGVATILFIPTKNAAPSTPKQYTFTGVISYMDPFTGMEVVRDLAPSTLTVSPSPNLDLTYFMQRDIYGDDPLTADVIEPCKPAEFALVINNKGYGDATNVRMITNKPEIVENEKGLLIDFELLSSQLKGKDNTLALGGSVATEFGDIPAHSTTYAQWWLQSSLLGHFTEYNVEATHVTSYGNEDLSLLDNVTIHELIHGFTVDENADPVTRAFLVNDITDAEDMPDMVYFSDGRQEEHVAEASSITMQRRSDTEYVVTFVPSGNGWNYGSAIDLTNGRQKLASVVRQSDGAQMSVDNFWLTDRTLRDGKEPVKENRLHLVANVSNTETYVLTFEPCPDTELEVESFTGLPEEGKVLTAQQKSVGVKFNKAIDDKTFSVDDITLSCQGQKVNVTEAVITKVNDSEFTIGLDKVTLENGYYVLTVQTADITDAEGFNGKTGKNASWIQLVDGKVKLTVKASPAEGGEVSPATGVVDYGSKITLKATSAEGYEFSGWRHGDDIVSEKTSLDYVMNGDDEFTALFSIKHFSVDIEYDAAHGVVENASSGIYEYGSILKMTAVPYDGYLFESWTMGEKLLGSNATYDFTVKDNAVIKANFIEDNTGITGIARTSVNIHPLPLRDVLYIDGDFDVVNKLMIIGVNGVMKIQASKITCGSAVDVTSLPQGVYIIKIITDSGIYTKKVVKK